jgi:hypothetical protein
MKLSKHFREISLNTICIIIGITVFGLAEYAMLNDIIYHNPPPQDSGRVFACYITLYIFATFIFLCAGFLATIISYVFLHDCILTPEEKTTTRQLTTTLISQKPHISTTTEMVQTV